MGRRQRGGRRAAGGRAAADAFEVAFVIEELVRDVEAVWIAFGGINHHDEDRCARHAFCASACFSDWDRYDNPGCRETKRCAYCDPEGARGCRACARRLRRHLIMVRRNFDLYPADVLAGVAEERARLEEFCVQYRLPSLCDLAPLPLAGAQCVCVCCKRPQPWIEGCDFQCCRRHGSRTHLRQRCAQFAREIAVAEELDGDWRFEAGEARRAKRRQLADVEIAADRAKRARLEALPWDGAYPMEEDDWE
jgi:hypothetical protein